MRSLLYKVCGTAFPCALCRRSQSMNTDTESTFPIPSAVSDSSRRKGVQAYLVQIAMLRALHHRPFALLWSGQTLSRIGDHLYQTVLLWWVLQTTGSPA